MKEIGVVQKLSGNSATVVIQRHAACGECGACQIGKEKMTMETRAKNQAGAVVGDTVGVEMAFTGVLKATGIMYGIPLVAFILGCALGYLLSGQFGFDPVLAPFFTGLALTVAAYLGIRLADKRGIFQSKYEPVITEIQAENEDCKKN